MASNAAKKINQPQLTPRSSTSTPQSNIQPQPHKQRLPFSPFEKMLMAVCALVIFIMMASVVKTQLTVSQQQQNLQNLQSKVSKVKQENTNDQQKIENLTSQSRLSQLAEQYGFTDANSSVRNVNR